MLTVTKVTRRFGGFTALHQVFFEVHEGEILGLIGPNGSGKTTLFNCVSGALRPTAGSIRFRGDEIGGLTPDRICHRGMARTFQIPRPFRKLSILDNVAVAAHYGANRPSTEAQARQRGNTANMIFSVRQLVAYVNRFMSLRAGDIISTGTPAGVAHGMKSPRYLEPGDIVEMGISGLGGQKNRVADG